MNGSDAKSRLGYGLDWTGQVGRDGQEGKVILLNFSLVTRNSSEITETAPCSSSVSRRR